MKGKKISIRTAFLLPIVFVVLMVILTFVLLWSYEYQWISKEQGIKLVNSVSANAKQKLNQMFKEPLLINAVYVDTIEREKLYGEEDLSRAEEISLEYFKTIHQKLPQISTIGFGTEKGDYVGIRTNEDLYNLMLIDKRTEGFLHIYQGESIESGIIRSFQEYDPRERPWYLPVRSQRKSIWSDVYVNFDEKMESTVSSMMPIFDGEGGFQGSTVVDVKLDLVHGYLRDIAEKSGGMVYIVNENWQIIAQSGQEASMVITDANPPTGRLLNAMESKTELVQKTAEYFQNSAYEYNQVYVKKMLGENQFLSVFKLDEPGNLSWKVITAIPESSLMGNVKSHQIVTVSGIVLLVILLFALASFAIRKVVQTIVKASQAARELSMGSFEADIPKDSYLRETHELISSFHVMANNLKESFQIIGKNEQKYRTLVENADEMIYSLSPEGVFLAINQSFEERFFMKREDVVNKNFKEVFAGSLKLAQLKYMFSECKKMLQKQVFRMDHEIDGQKRYFIVSLIPVLDEKENLEMILGSNVEVTELIKAQQEIERLHLAERDNLENVVKERTEEVKELMEELMNKEKLASLGGLVSGIAHEINTPLGVAVSAASFLERTNQKNTALITSGMMTKQDLISYMGEVEESSQILNNNLHRAAELVKSFKAISVNQTAELKTTFHLKNYIESIILSLKHEYKNKKIEFEVSCDSELQLNSYPGAFSQIFTNLIMNSLIHGFAQREEGIIEIHVVQEEEGVKIIYRDDGMGMEEEILKKVFDPFFTTNRKKGGSGLGMSVVYNLITGQLRGKIYCDSTLGQGTQYTMSFPKGEV